MLLGVAWPFHEQDFSSQARIHLYRDEEKNFKGVEQAPSSSLWMPSKSSWNIYRQVKYRRKSYIKKLCISVLSSPGENLQLHQVLKCLGLLENISLCHLFQFNACKGLEAYFLEHAFGGFYAAFTYSKCLSFLTLSVVWFKNELLMHWKLWSKWWLPYQKFESYMPWNLYKKVHSITPAQIDVPSATRTCAIIRSVILSLAYLLPWKCCSSLDILQHRRLENFPASFELEITSTSSRSTYFQTSCVATKIPVVEEDSGIWIRWNSLTIHHLAGSPIHSPTSHNQNINWPKANSLQIFPSSTPR